MKPILSPQVEEYINLGWSVIPLLPSTKKPALAWKARQTRRLTLDKLFDWVEKKGKDDYNVGIVTGEISGIVVLDIDGPEGLSAVEERGGVPITPTVQTSPSKLHHYFRHPGFEVRNFARKLPGLDLRGDGGYVMAPPSVHPNGTSYVWLTTPTTPLAPMPEWLLEQCKVRVAAEAPAVAAAQGTAYGRKALNEELNNIVDTPNGSRNDQLNKSSFAVGQLVGMQELDYASAMASLIAAGQQVGLSHKEVTATVQSGLQSGIAQPREVKDLVVPMTDSGNAELIAHQHGAGVRYVQNWGSWLLWNGRYWETDKRFAMYEKAKQTARSWKTKAAAITDNTQLAASLVKWGNRSESHAGIVNALNLTRGRPGVTLVSDELDADPWRMNVVNGVLNLLTGDVEEHRPEGLHTKVAGVPYIPDAPAPRWLKFLKQIFAGDEELIAYVQRAVGYSLTGNIGEQCLFFMYGTGANGKSTFTEVLFTVLGDYARKCPSSMVMSTTQGGIPNDIARLEGARFAVASELDTGKLNETVVKDLTGGDTIVARFLRQEFFEFQPTHKLWMYGNHKPIIQGTDDGIWRRIRLIPFILTIPENKRDTQLLGKLQEEAPGVLAWAIRGLLEWRKHGLGTCQVVEEATKSYRSEMDLLGLFLEDICHIDPDASALSTVLYTAYRGWAEDAGLRPLSSTMFGRLLGERGYEKKRTANGNRYLGLGLAKPKVVETNEKGSVYLA